MNNYLKIFYFVVVRSKLAILMTSSLIGGTIFIVSGYSLYEVLIPIMGRSGTALNPELLIGAFTSLMCIVVGSTLVSHSLQASLYGAVGKDFVYHACGHEFESRLKGKFSNFPYYLWLLLSAHYNQEVRFALA